MPVWTAMHEADDEYDLEPDDLPEYDLRDEFDEMSRSFSPAHFAEDPPEPFVHDFATTQDEPNAERCTWRCLACDSDNHYQLSAYRWLCDECGGQEFYETTRPTKKLTQDGTWLFLPHASKRDDRSSHSSKRRRRRAKKNDPPADEGFEGREWPESEQRTDDPCVEPESPHHVPRSEPPPHHRRSAVPQRPPQTEPSVKVSQTREDELLSALKKLISKKDADDSADWNSLKGPKQGTKWRGGTAPAPPSWQYDKDDLRAYDKFRKKVDLWMLRVAPFQSKKESALRQYLHQFEMMRRYPGESMWQYANRFRRSQRALASVGVNITATYDDEALGTRLLDRAGQSHQDQRMILASTMQSLDFSKIVEALTLQWPEFRPPPPVVGASGPRETPKGISKGRPSSSSSSSLASTSTAPSRSTTYSSGKPGSFVKRTYVAEHDDMPEEESLPVVDEEDDTPQDDQPDEPPLYDPEEDDPDQQEDLPNLAEVAEVLTLTAKKLSGLTLGRKFTSNPKRMPKNAKKDTHCSACGAKGRWYQDPECPMNKSGSKPFEKRPPSSAASGGKPTSSSSSTGGKKFNVSFLHHDHGTIDVHEPPPQESYGTMFSIGMVSLQPELHPPYLVHESSFNGPEMFAGYLVLDSGCQRMCCGKTWLSAHLQKIDKMGLIPKYIQANDVFQFGKGTPSTSTTRAYIPAGIGGHSLLLGGAVLREEIPLLGSNSLLTNLGAEVNFAKDVVFFNRLQAEVKIHRIGGHMAVDICDFVRDVHKADAWKQLSHESFWNEPHPELVLPPQVSPALLTFA